MPGDELEVVAPTIVEEAVPGSLGDAYNAYAARKAELWAASTFRPERTTTTTGSGVVLELPTYPELFDTLVEDVAAQEAAGVDLSEPLPE